MDKFNVRKGITEKEIDGVVNKVLDVMTLKEKVASMSGNNFYLLLLKDHKFGVRPYPGGGVKRLNIPPFLFTDGPRGVIMPGSTCFPVSMARGASWDILLEEKVGEVIGKEARAQGANLFGGVCINLLRHPAWGRAQETYGEESFHIGEFGAALVRGVQKHNVMATAKHYAANSIEYSRFKVDVQLSERTLREDFDGASAGFPCDLDKDGDIDIVGTAYDGDTLSWFENVGFNNFIEYVISENLDRAVSSCAFDIDNDSDIDIFTGAGNEIAFWENV